VLILTALLSLTSPARAQDAPSSSSDGLSSAKPPYDKQVSVTLSPFLLALPMLELTTEGRLADRVGLAAVTGVGGVGGVTLIELGVQGRYYVVGSFDHGMELGAELLYLYVGGSPTSSSSVSAQGSGFSAAPFIGYKIAARFGLTFDAQLGVGYTAVAATASSGAVSSSASSSGVTPLLNLNLGWSF